jgi:hypothetical protein
MAPEINEGVRYALTPSACSIVRAAPTLVREAGQNSPRPPRLLDRVREANRLRHGSRSTEKSYIGWIRRFILFHGKRHPAEMGAPEVAQFLSSLAVEGRVAASTQNQALSALLFLYRYILHQELPWLEGWPRRVLCLRCSHSFVSASPSTRMCDSCRSFASDLALGVLASFLEESRPSLHGRRTEPARPP